MYLTTDHSGLNKFGGVEDENFALVLPEIQRMVRIAPKQVEERYRRMDFSSFFSLLDPLFFNAALTFRKRTP